MPFGTQGRPANEFAGPIRGRGNIFSVFDFGGLFTLRRTLTGKPE